MSEFREAYIRFYNSLGIEKYPITFQTWSNLSEDLRGIALYVNFYEQVTLAWYKAKQAYRVNHDECDGVSNLLHRLQKVSEKVIMNEKMFTKSYIYTCCYRSLSSVTRALRNRTLEFNNLMCDSYNKTVNTDYGDIELIDMIEGESFETQYLSYLFDETYANETDEVKEVIDYAMQKSKVPKRLLTDDIKQHLLDIFEPYMNIAI